MSLSKSVVLTVDGYTIKLSSPLNFYQDDQLYLLFEIVEKTIEVKGGIKTKNVVPIKPLRAILLFETPTGVDSIESAGISENAVLFHLSSEQTQHIGVSRMQIQLLDEDCCRLTLPPFEFEIRKNICDGQLEIVDIMLYDANTDSLLVDENGNFVIVSRIIELKK